MSLVSRILARVAKLPPADTYTIAVEKHLEVPMPDGVVLLADHYRPRHTDFFVRLLDVTPSGQSLNICDGLLRVAPSRPVPMAEGVFRVEVVLSPTAYRFRRGHRMRVQVSSGAFPRFARNLGSGEPLSTATTLCVAEQRVYHDPAHPSAIILPSVDEHQEQQETEAR